MKADSGSLLTYFLCVPLIYIFVSILLLAPEQSFPTNLLHIGLRCKYAKLTIPHNLRVVNQVGLGVLPVILSVHTLICHCVP